MFFNAFTIFTPTQPGSNKDIRIETTILFSLFRTHSFMVNKVYYYYSFRRGNYTKNIYNPIPFTKNVLAFIVQFIYAEHAKLTTSKTHLIITSKTLAIGGGDAAATLGPSVY